jgi:hypothetical protein
MRARPLPVTVAAVLLALFSLLNVIFPLLPTEGVPAFVVYLGRLLGVVGLIAAAGLCGCSSGGLCGPSSSLACSSSSRQLRDSPRPRPPCCGCLQR